MQTMMSVWLTGFEDLLSVVCCHIVVHDNHVDRGHDTSLYAVPVAAYKEHPLRPISPRSLHNLLDSDEFPYGPWCSSSYQDIMLQTSSFGLH